MKTKTIFRVSLWVIATALSSLASDLPRAMLTLKVVGEDGLPIPNAKAGITFEQVNPRGELILKPAEGMTDGRGQFSATGGTTWGVYYGARKPGYYITTNCKYEFRGEPQGGRWQPWNPALTVVLKKIINPVPMYAKRVRTEIPVENAPVGFDLMEADWVTPHGKGRVSDLVFHLTRRFASEKDYEVTLHLGFSNDGDGIQTVLAPPFLEGSWLRLPRYAPTEGYEPRWEQTHSYRQPPQERREHNYFFRVRTQLADGKPQKSLYGKIHGDICVAGYGTPKTLVMFTYYLNPDGTRNMEYDPKRNLFKNVGRNEVYPP